MAREERETGESGGGEGKLEEHRQLEVLRPSVCNGALIWLKWLTKLHGQHQHHANRCARERGREREMECLCVCVRVNNFPISCNLISVVMRSLFRFFRRGEKPRSAV